MESDTAVEFEENKCLKVKTTEASLEYCTSLAL